MMFFGGWTEFVTKFHFGKLLAELLVLVLVGSVFLLEFTFGAM
jgi:hypothetical protein